MIRIKVIGSKAENEVQRSVLISKRFFKPFKSTKVTKRKSLSVRTLPQLLVMTKNSRTDKRKGFFFLTVWVFSPDAVAMVTVRLLKLDQNVMSHRRNLNVFISWL